MLRIFLLLVGMSEREQMAIFQTLAAVLHLCNVQVKHQSEDQCRISVGFFSLSFGPLVSPPTPERSFHVPPARR